MNRYNIVKTVIIAFVLLAVASNSMAQKKNYKVVDTTVAKSMENNNKKFDIEYFEKNKDYKTCEFTRQDGTKIWQYYSGFDLYIEKETPPNPKLYIIQRKYYLDGSLESEGILLPGDLPIGTWRKYDENGNLVKETDWDSTYGKFDYNKVILFLDKKGHISIKTGRGREEFTIGVDREKHCWDVNVWPGATNNYKGFEYLLDLDTGKVKKKGKILPSGS